MVRKGSPVRVRQRASTKPLLVGGFLISGPGSGRWVAEHLRNTAPSPGRPGTPADLALGAARSCMQSSAGALDLRFGGHALARVEILPDARVVAQQGRRAVAELLGDVLRRLPFVDEKRREARAQVARPHTARSVCLVGAQSCRSCGAAERPAAPVVPVVLGPEASTAVGHDRGVGLWLTARLAPGVQ